MCYTVGLGSGQRSPPDHIPKSLGIKLWTQSAGLLSVLLLKEPASSCVEVFVLIQVQANWTQGLYKLSGFCRAHSPVNVASSIRYFNFTGSYL